MPSVRPLPEAIKDVARHVFRPDVVATEIEKLEQGWQQNYPISNIAQGHVARALGLIEWKSLYPPSLRQLITAIPAIQMGSSGLATMGRAWPWWLAGDIQQAFGNRKVSIEPDGEHNGSCDIFVSRANSDILSSPSMQVSSQTPGIAIECKALESMKAFEKNLNKSAEQLAKYGGGLAAVDVSVPLRAMCEERQYLEFRDIYAFCERQLDDFERRAEALFKTDNPQLKYLKGILIHACVFSTIKHSVGVEGGYLVYQYHQIRGETIGDVGDPAIHAILEKLQRRAPKVLYCAPPSKAFVTRIGAVLGIALAAKARDFFLALTPVSPESRIGPEVPIPILSSVTKGNPDRYVHDYLIQIERTDEPHPYDMKVSGGPRRPAPASLAPERKHRFKLKNKKSR